jgi:ATP-dependent Clp protease ATP-binding subunit ClpX
LNRQAVGYSTSKNVDNDKDNLLQYIIPKDIKDFGLMGIIGRLPVLTHMDPLDRETLGYFDSAKNADQTIHKIILYG